MIRLLLIPYVLVNLVVLALGAVVLALICAWRRPWSRAWGDFTRGIVFIGEVMLVYGVRLWRAS